MSVRFHHTDVYWVVPFRAALGDGTDLSLVQVSLPASSDPRESVKVGKALASLRQEGYAIIGTGQVVHNLRDLCR